MSTHHKNASFQGGFAGQNHDGRDWKQWLPATTCAPWKASAARRRAGACATPARRRGLPFPPARTSARAAGGQSFAAARAGACAGDRRHRHPVLAGIQALFAVPLLKPAAGIGLRRVLLGRDLPPRGLTRMAAVARHGRNMIASAIGRQVRPVPPRPSRRDHPIPRAPPAPPSAHMRSSAQPRSAPAAATGAAPPRAGLRRYRHRTGAR